jgi:ribosomal protein S18 acetylase RimI-like enzyme
MWIGHFLVDPMERGRLRGVRFAQALLARAFTNHAASEVLLVVLPDNAVAIRCYERAGFVIVGEERKYFETTRREHRFLRMGIQRDRYRKLVSAGKSPRDPLPMLGHSAER